MRYGFFCIMADPAGERPYTRMIRELREQVRFLDQAGFETVWLGEHHFGPEGMGNTPNPILLAADLAARTERIRLGLGAVILPWWHPIRLAEDIAVLDHLTEGRLEVGIGRGVWPREGPNFHPKADPRDGEANMELFRETLEVMRKVWTEEFFAHEGPNYRFPAPGGEWNHPMYPSDPRWRDGARITRLCVVPKPYQSPHPPLWQVCSSQSSIRFAASQGINALMWQPPPKGIRHFGDMYAEIRSATDGRARAARDHVGVLRQVYVAPTMEQARGDAERGATFTYLYNNPFRGLTMFMNPGEEPAPDMEMGWDFLTARGGIMVGTPEYVAERIAELRDVGGVDYLLPDLALPFLEQKEILSSMELFATRVMPLLDAA